MRDVHAEAAGLVARDPELAREIACVINERTLAGMGLTGRQRELYDFIAAFIRKSGGAPTYNEMAEHMRLSSKSGINRLVVALEERGLIRRLPNRARAIELVEIVRAAA